MRPKLFLTFSLLLFLLGCSGWNQSKEKSESPDWPMEYKNLARTSSFGQPAIPPLTLKWKFKADNAIYGNPAVVNGAVYFITRFGHCYALDSKTGKQIWEKNIHTAGFDNSLVVDKGIIYSNDGFALSTTDGGILWKGSAWSEYPAFVTDSVVYYGQGGSYWTRLDVKTGKQSNYYIECCPVIGATIVDKYLVNFGTLGELEVWNTNLQSNGYPKKEFDIPYRERPEGGSTFAVGLNRYLYIPTASISSASSSFGIMACDLKKPKKKGEAPLIWHTKVEESTSPSYYKGIVYTGNNPVTALDAKIGKILWTTYLPQKINQKMYNPLESIAVMTSPAVSHQWVYISSLANNFVQYLYILDSNNGKILQQEQLSQPRNDSFYSQYFNTPAVVDGWVYVGSIDSCLYAFQGQEEKKN